MSILPEEIKVSRILLSHGCVFFDFPFDSKISWSSPRRLVSLGIPDKLMVLSSTMKAHYEFYESGPSEILSITSFDKAEWIILTLPEKDFVTVPFNAKHGPCLRDTNCDNT
ncbi:hypothetical protein OS493_032260 [Desmophyllum pertusum]|uniref:Uncharacterized protein n=1 Tax=Desmophyllum pertusum TaxID=174260 RepID=A0A9X0CWD0_9CNID|nr:hypothetical protein OS493_032260 [Desmophyllum pertusum]